MQVTVVFRSVTYAQRAERLLLQNGITVNITKAPFGIGTNSCCYGLRLNSRNLSDALRILSDKAIPFTGVVTRDERGAYRRVGL